MIGVSVLVCLLILNPAHAVVRKKIPINDVATPGSTPPPSSPPTGSRQYRGAYSPQTSSRACPSRSVLRVDFAPSATGDGRIYGNMFGGGVLLAGQGDVFEYEIMWKDSNCNCGAEFEVGNVFRLRDSGILDALGYSPHSERNANMSTVAFGKWYKRQFGLNAVEGKYVDKFVLSAFVTPGSTVTAFFKYIRIVRGTEVRKAIFDSGSEPPTVNPTFPGTITASCQHEVFVDDTLVVSGLQGGALEHGGRGVITGLLQARSLVDLATVNSGESGFSQVEEDSCPAEGFWDLFEKVLTSRDDRLEFIAMSVIVRLKQYPVVLLPLLRWNCTDDSSPVHSELSPLLLFLAFDVPPLSALSHLFEHAIVEVQASYVLRVDSWMSDVFTVVVRSIPLFAH